MTKTKTLKPNLSVFAAIIVALIILIVILVFFVLQISKAHSQVQNAYNNLSSNYMALKTQSQSQQVQISTLQNQLVANKTLLSSITTHLSSMTNKYNITEYNLTHPYTRILYNDFTINLQAGTYNYYISPSNSSYKPGEFNFSFTAKYPGYVIFNGTSSNPYWLLAITQNNYTLTRNNSFSENTWFLNYPLNQSIAPTQELPILPGIVHVYIYNYNSTGDTVSFSLKYVGFHTS